MQYQHSLLPFQEGYSYFKSKFCIASTYLVEEEAAMTVAT